MENENFENPNYDSQNSVLETWQAPEMIVGEKNTLWYVILGVFGVIAITVAIFLQFWSTIPLVIVSILAIHLTRSNSTRERNISYALTIDGVAIGDSFYSYEEFRAFGISNEFSNYSITLFPKKRFSPSVSIVFPKEKGESITDIFGSRMPMEEIHRDIIDRIVRRLKL